MPYSFENITVNNNIETFSVFQVSKMPDLFLEVEFHYPKCRLWRTCIPIYEKYQGVDFIKSEHEDALDWILKCYDELNPDNSRAWNISEEKYWENHKSANKAKPLFDVLNVEDRYHLTGWGCRQCTDTSKVNSQAASRIRALKKDHGYHIATKDFYCDVCKEETTHDFLIRLPRKRGMSNKRYTIPNSVIIRAKALFDYTDACFGDKYVKSSRVLIIDHKFPATRWAAGETRNYAGMTDEEILRKFQLLTQQTNLQKDRYCSRCFNEKRRGDFFGIKWYPKGDEKWRGANNSDENGCIGCPWYDLLEWKRKFNQYLNDKQTNPDEGS